MEQEMTSLAITEQEQCNARRCLFEAKSFEQTRERTFLCSSPHRDPCRMKMVKAGWFAVRRNDDDELVAVCLYCKIVCTQWTDQDNPEQVHRILSPNCPFVRCNHSPQTPQSPPIDSIPRHQRIRPSKRAEASRLKRLRSFEKWPHGAPCPQFDALAAAGFFYTDLGTTVQCFSCDQQMPVTRTDHDLMAIHLIECAFARHLRNRPLRAPLNIRPSEKVYELIEKQVHDSTFYLLRCTNGSTPSILLAANVVVPNVQTLEISDKYLRRLRPSEQLQEKVNWATGSDGPLVDILHRLSNDSNAVRSIPLEQRSLSRVSSAPMDLDVDPAFRCRSCLTLDASPHSVPIRCFHIGLCCRECAPKWMTCVTCGYTRGKTVCIWHV